MICTLQYLQIVGALTFFALGIDSSDNPILSAICIVSIAVVLEIDKDNIYKLKIKEMYLYHPLVVMNVFAIMSIVLLMHIVLLMRIGSIAHTQ